MSTVLKQITEDWELYQKATSNLSTCSLPKNNRSRHSIKHKENYFKHKCNKALKNKLKKYKLRRDGKEDPDVVNVSHIFQSTLKIKLPHNNNNEQLNLYDSERPKNYLFKMVRRKKEVDNVKAFKTLFKEPPEKNTILDIPVAPNDSTDNEVVSPNSQDKKQTNAFKLMMESRNKSIGGNSPGKEKPIDETEKQLLKEEKSNKAKRLLTLQKMAEQKGSLKKKEQEELLEESIKMKMEKRAERLTNMLVNSNGKKVKSKKPQPKVTEVEKNTPTIDCALNEKHTVNKINNGALHLINIFEDSVNGDNKKKNRTPKSVPKEDLEFLKKLSPSIKKKENMLCYFKKLEKDCDSSSPVSTDKDNNEPESPIIKVKFGARNKKKIKKKKLHLNSQISIDSEEINKYDLEQNKCELEEVPDENSFVTNAPTDGKNENRKRKRDEIAVKKRIQLIEHAESLSQPLLISETNNGRPKRNVRKPLQYIDDVLLSSSDEEYNIFTPKKKKHNDKKTDSPKSIKDPISKYNEGIKQSKDNTKEMKKPAKSKDPDAIRKPNSKLAPIFAPKPLLDPAALEAKQRFLQSGVPEKLKRIASQQKQIDTEFNNFPTVHHIQQITNTDNTIYTCPFIDSLRSDSEPELSPIKCPEKAMKLILSPGKPSTPLNVMKPDSNIRKVLQNIKQSYPKFPVYRTYQLLKEKSKGEFGECMNFPEFDNSIEIISNVVDMNKVQVDKLNWTDKYKPMVTNQIIGNFESTKELKKWLESWSANENKGKTNGTADSDSSDFCHSDTDSRDSMKTNDNLLVLTGPTGCGKTTCVYAVAAGLAIKVIEVNASSKRNGKIMLQDLQEATQSHKVNRGKGSSTENSQKSQDIVEVDLTIKSKKRGRPKKCKEVKAKSKIDYGTNSQTTNSQETTRTGMSLILIDDADIVFDQDEGFCSAITQLVQFSKRPVILVTTSLDCPHLQRFMQTAKILNMKPLLPRMLGTWLDIMCLADSGTCWPGLGSVLLDLYRGDIRKAINCLQFYATTHVDESAKLDENLQNIDSVYDENSSMSWAGSENHDERSLACETGLQLVDSLWKQFMERESHLLHIRFPSDLWQVWWNIPNFLIKPPLNTKENEKSDDRQRLTRELHLLSSVLDNISTADYFGRLRPDATTNICSQPWFSAECDSSSELETFSYYNKSHDVNDEISRTLVVRSICNAQTCSQYSEELYVKPTSMTLQRNRDKVVSRHDNISNIVNTSATLDRRALALDYWSSCRTICRFEKAKTDTNSKRNNRFCHYLRSLKIMCKNDVFDKLGESLCVKEGND